MGPENINATFMKSEQTIPRNERYEETGDRK